MRERTARVIEEWSSACDAEISVMVLGGAWKPTIVTLLDDEGVLRFGELRRRLGDPTPKVLTRQLRELEADGVIVRTVYAEVPPKVEYSLTDLGRSAVPVLHQLSRWGAEFATQARVPAGP